VGQSALILVLALLGPFSVLLPLRVLAVLPQLGPMAAHSRKLVNKNNYHGLAWVPNNRRVVGC
jgi:hypothetical protein